MNHISCFATTLLIAYVAGCAQEPPYDLTLHAKALSPLGANLHVGLEEIDGDVLIDNEWFQVDDGSLNGTYGAILAQGVTYQVHLFYDLDNNDECSPPPIDHVWTTTLGPVESKHTVDLGKLPLDSSGCDFFRAQ